MAADDVLSLEQLRDSTCIVADGPFRRAFDAAIRERDELRSALSEMRELARDYERDRDKAEAELAALRKRTESALEALRIARDYAAYANAEPDDIAMIDAVLAEDDDGR